MNEQEVKIRYFDLSSMKDVMLHAAFNPEENDRLKLKALANLGIVPMAEEKPLHAWIRVMSEENNLPYTQPAHKAIVDNIFGNPAVSRFMFFLA